jgi:hypothetical protein
MRHDVLLTTQRPTLNSLFRAHGYQTFGLYPALDWEWPERAFYGFDVFVARRDLRLWGAGPGLLAGARPVQRGSLRAASPAVERCAATLRFFPDNHLPPAVQPGTALSAGLVKAAWTGSPSMRRRSSRSLAEQPNWLNMFPDFLRMVAYTYQWLGAYLRQPEPRETIYLLVGDHQPAANITGEDGVVGCAGAYRQPRWRAAGTLRRAGFPARACATTASAGSAACPDRNDAAGFSRRRAIGRPRCRWPQAQTLRPGRRRPARPSQISARPSACILVRTFLPDQPQRPLRHPWWPGHARARPPRSIRSPSSGQRQQQGHRRREDGPDERAVARRRPPVPARSVRRCRAAPPGQAPVRAWPEVLAVRRVQPTTPGRDTRRELSPARMPAEPRTAASERTQTGSDANAAAQQPVKRAVTPLEQLLPLQQRQRSRWPRRRGPSTRRP